MKRARPELALKDMLGAYFAQKGAVVRGVPQKTPQGLIVRFKSGGPFGLKKLLLSDASVEKITEELLGGGK